MTCFQSDLSSRLPETSDDGIPQKVKKHTLRECKIITTFTAAPACWAILINASTFGFQLALSVFPGLKVVFSIFTLEDVTVLSSAFT